MTAPIRVLIVDPDESSTAEYCRVLSGKGWQTDHVSGLMDALSLTGRNSYDVAILDMSLADSVAPEAWPHLKRECPQMLGIFTTRSPVLYQSINPRNLDVFAYLLKPFRTEALPQLITIALNYSSADLKTFRGEQWLAMHAPAEKPHRKIASRLLTRNSLFSVLFAFLLAMVLFAGSIAVVSAAQRSLPGEMLYPVKTSTEKMQLALTLDSNARVSLLLEQAQTRLDEIQLLADQQRFSEIPPVLSSFMDKDNRAVAELRILTKQNSTLSTPLRSEVKMQLSRAESVLQALLDTVPDAAKPAIAHALAVSQENRANAEGNIRGRSNSGGNDSGIPGNSGTSGNGVGPPMTPPGQDKTPGPPITPPGQDKTPGPPMTPPGQDKMPGPPMTPPGQAKTPGPPMTPPGQDKTPGPPMTPPGQTRTPGPPITPPGQDKTPGAPSHAPNSNYAP